MSSLLYHWAIPAPSLNSDIISEHQTAWDSCASSVSQPFVDQQSLWSFLVCLPCISPSQYRGRSTCHITVQRQICMSCHSTEADLHVRSQYRGRCTCQVTLQRQMYMSQTAFMVLVVPIKARCPFGPTWFVSCIWYVRPQYSPPMICMTCSIFLAGLSNGFLHTFLIESWGLLTKETW